MRKQVMRSGFGTFVPKEEDFRVDSCLIAMVRTMPVVSRRYLLRITQNYLRDNVTVQCGCIGVISALGCTSSGRFLA